MIPPIVVIDVDLGFPFTCETEEAVTDVVGAIEMQGHEAKVLRPKP